MPHNDPAVDVHGPRRTVAMLHQGDVFIVQRASDWAACRVTGDGAQILATHAHSYGARRAARRAVHDTRDQGDDVLTPWLLRNGVQLLEESRPRASITTRRSPRDRARKETLRTLRAWLATELRSRGRRRK